MGPDALSGSINNTTVNSTTDVERPADTTSDTAAGKKRKKNKKDDVANPKPVEPPGELRYLSVAFLSSVAVNVGVARIFSGGGRVHFLLQQKSDDLFLVIALPYMVIYVIHTATNYLFISSAGVHLTKFSPIFASFQQKIPRKIFFVTLWARGCTCTPCTLPGYAYA